MTLHLQATRVATGHDEDGLLVFDESQRLLAVFVRLGELHENRGCWFLEVGFGRLDLGPDHPCFDTLEDVEAWAERRRSRSLVGSQHPQSAPPKRPVTLAAKRKYDEIQRRAYELWEKRGRPQGYESELWAQAERELKEEASGRARRGNEAE